MEKGGEISRWCSYDNYILVNKCLINGFGLT